METDQLSQLQYDFLKKACERAGIKLTHQRLEIFREAVNGNDHLSAEEVHHRLKQRLPTLALDTVYRTLATFEELGIVRRLHLAGKQTRFDSNLKPHHHFICRICGRIDDFHWPAFDRIELPDEVEELGAINNRHLELHGICRDCLKEEH